MFEDFCGAPCYLLSIYGLLWAAYTWYLSQIHSRVYHYWTLSSEHLHTHKDDPQGLEKRSQDVSNAMYGKMTHCGAVFPSQFIFDTNISLTSSKF